LGEGWISDKPEFDVMGDGGLTLPYFKFFIFIVFFYFSQDGAVHFASNQRLLFSVSLGLSSFYAGYKAGSV